HSIIHDQSAKKAAHLQRLINVAIQRPPYVEQWLESVELQSIVLLFHTVPDGDHLSLPHEADWHQFQVKYRSDRNVRPAQPLRKPFFHTDALIRAESQSLVYLGYFQYSVMDSHPQAKYRAQNDYFQISRYNAGHQ